MGSVTNQRKQLTLTLLCLPRSPDPFADAVLPSTPFDRQVGGMQSVDATDVATKINWNGLGMRSQFNALFRKNMSFQGRQTKINCLQVFVPIFFSAILIAVKALFIDNQPEDINVPCYNETSARGPSFSTEASFYRSIGYERRLRQRENATYLPTPNMRFVYAFDEPISESLMGSHKIVSGPDIQDWYVRLQKEVRYSSSCTGGGGRRSRVPGAYDECTTRKGIKASIWDSARCDEAVESQLPCNSSFGEFCAYGNCTEDATCRCDTGYSGDTCRLKKVQRARPVQRPESWVNLRESLGEDVAVGEDRWFCEGRYTSNADPSQLDSPFDAVDELDKCKDERTWCTEYYANRTMDILLEFNTSAAVSGGAGMADDVKFTSSGMLGKWLPYPSGLNSRYVMDSNADTAVFSKAVQAATLDFSGKYSAEEKARAMWIAKNINVLRDFEFVPASPNSKRVIEDTIRANWGSEATELLGGLHFRTMDTTGTESAGSNGEKISFAYDVWYNQSANAYFAADSGDQNIVPTSDLTAEVFFEAAIENFVKMQTSWKGFPVDYRERNVEFLSFIGAFFYWLAFGFQMPVFMQKVCFDKEHHLRQIMRMSGLSDRMYWAVNYCFDYCMYLIIPTFVFIYWRWVNPIAMFANAPVSLWVVVLLLWGHCLIAFSYTLAAFVTRSQTAIVIGFAAFIAQYVFGLVIFFQSLFGGGGLDKLTAISLMILPYWTLLQFMVYLGFTVAYGGTVTWDDVYLGGGGVSGKLPLGDCLMGLFVSWFIWMGLAWYIDQVSDPANNRGWCFPITEAFCFISPCFRNRVSSRSTSDANAVSNQVEEPDVAAERMLAEDEDESSKAGYVVRVLNLRKVYGAGKDAKVAVDNVSLGIKYGECFGLLGPNGAGKTTLIHMLCGLFAPTSGTSQLYLKDLLQDMTQIQKIMGVCPQHDLLWGDVTGEDHLYFYGRLRGLSGSALKRAVQIALAEVSLAFAGKKLSKQYSGGMKRRLSVATALIGEPKLVYLDEPSTGLDPASRRKLWDVIRKHRVHSAMVLTTHSMEESEVLCDRLAIMADGKLRCIGTAAELKAKFGQGYKFSVSVKGEEQLPVAEKFITSDLFAGAEGVQTVNRIGSTINFNIPNNALQKVGMSTVFRKMEENKSATHVADWGISETTLEEVFQVITADVFKRVGAANKKGGDSADGNEKAKLEFQGAPGFDSWFAAMPKQTWLLMKKNFQIYRRNTRATLLQTIVGVFFMFLLLLLQFLTSNVGENAIDFREVREGTPIPVNNVFKCEPHAYLDSDGNPECRSVIFFRPGNDQFTAFQKYSEDMESVTTRVIDHFVKSQGIEGKDVNGGYEEQRYDASNAGWKQDINWWLYNHLNYTKTVIIFPPDFGYKIQDFECDENGSPTNCLGTLMNVSGVMRRVPSGDALNYLDMIRQYGIYWESDRSCVRTPNGGTSSTDNDAFACRRDLRFTVQYNNTADCKWLFLGCEDMEQVLQLPAQTAMHQSITAAFSTANLTASGGPDFTGSKPLDGAWDVRHVAYNHKDVRYRYQRSIVASYLPRFMVCAIIFNFVVQLGIIGREKEFKLHEALRMVGMRDAAYWVSWFLVNCVVKTIGIILMLAVPYIFGLEDLVATDFSVVIVTLLLFGISMVCLCFFMAAVVPSASSATILGFAFFMLIYIFSDFVSFLLDSEDPDIAPYKPLVILFSPLCFIQASVAFTNEEVSAGGGVRWQCPEGARGCTDVDNSNASIYTIRYMWTWMIIDSFLYLFLGWYLDKVVPTAYGSAESWCFFLNPCWWCGKTSSEKPPKPYQPGPDDSLGSGEEKDGLDGKEDEKDVMQVAKAALMRTDESDSTFTKPLDENTIAVDIRRLNKTFGGHCTVACWQPQKQCCSERSVFTLLCCCCGYDSCGCPCPTRPKKFQAVKGVSYTVKKDELFCLLGPNGAGKTTTINMLTGLHPQTNGSAIVDGKSTRTNMKEVRKVMGCCPQHDILWHELTSAEHVSLFAGLKNVQDIESEVENRLAAVDLLEVRDLNSGVYSGGMQRRLSVTLSLTGEPKVAYLDEPTTGMDPVSRRHVWDLIEDQKKGRTIMLTTHSMEEADVLGNRIAIMGKGRLRAFGTSLHLKTKFGAGYQFILQCKEGDEQQVIQSVQKHTPSMDLLDKKSGSIIFKHRIKGADADQSKKLLSAICGFLEALEKNKAAFSITDFSIAMTTLEEVFLSLFKQDEELEVGSAVEMLKQGLEAGRFKTHAVRESLLEQCDILAPLLDLNELAVLDEACKYLDSTDGDEQANVKRALFGLCKLVPSLKTIELELPSSWVPGQAFKFEYPDYGVQEFVPPVLQPGKYQFTVPVRITPLDRPYPDAQISTEL